MGLDEEPVGARDRRRGEQGRNELAQPPLVAGLLPDPAAAPEWVAS